MIDHDNLEEFADGRAYDRRDPSDTGVAFYRALARETGGPVLELACGTGRVAIPIAQLGIPVTGLDVAPAMLDRARAKTAGLDLPTRWVQGDARTFDLGERYRLVFLTGNAFQLFLTRPDQEALFDRVRAHLHDDGRFAFETRNPHPVGAPDGPTNEGLFPPLDTQESEQDHGRYVDENGREVRISRTRRYDPVNQILHWTTYRRWKEKDKEQEEVSRIALRFTYPRELEALLHYNGWEIERWYGSWERGEFEEKSKSMIVVCKKKK